jgi:signal peptidase II
LVLLREPAVQIFSLALIAGGALGNYIDRIRLGYVIDFISLNIDMNRMPFFNFADFFILIGCVLFVFVI